MAEILGRAKRTVLVENNATGQLGGLIAEKTRLDLDERILEFSGRQFFTDVLEERIRNLL